MSHGETFIGREYETALIRRVAERVRDRRPQFIYVEGLPGVGKTALIKHALRPYQHWQIIERHFDEAVQRVTGEGLRRVFGPQGSSAEDRDALVQQLLPQDPAQKEGTAVVITGFHHGDESTVEALLSQLRVTYNAPVLLVLEGRPTQRKAPARLVRTAQISRHGHHIKVEPLSVQETGELVAEYLGTPVGHEVAERVHCETAGYPYLAVEVGRRLREIPLGRRSLGPVLGDVVALEDPGMAEVASSVSAELADPAALQALHLLAAAGQTLRMSEIGEALGSTADLNRILETGLVVWDEARLGCRIKNRPISRAVLGALDEIEHAAVHRLLASVVEENRAFQHRVWALRLAPAPEESETLVAELMRDGRQAFAEGDVERSFARFHAACTLQPEEESVAALARTAVMLGRVGVLEEFQQVCAEELPQSPLTQACLAFVALQQGEVEQAVEELRKQSRLTVDLPGALLYAQAVADVSMHCALRGLTGRANTPRMRALMMLTAYREKLLTQSAGGETSQHMPEEWCVGQLESTRAAIDLWQMLEYRDSEQMVQAIDDIGEVIERLERLPFTEYAELSLRAARGTRLRQLGDPVAAYRDLAAVAASDHSDGFLLHAQAQLALLLFSAGYWDEAHKTALRAAERVLLQGENASTLIVYAMTTLVPVLRNEDDRAAQLLKKLCEVKEEHGPITGAVIDWIEACRCIVQDNHEVAAQLLLKMQERHDGWWTLGVEPVMLFARSLARTGWASLLERVEASLAVKEVPAKGQVLQTVLLYVEGLQWWVSGKPMAAYQVLSGVLSRVDGWEEFRIDGVHAAGGGSFQLYRALLGVDIAALVMEFPRQLAEFREAASECAETAAVVFRQCGVGRLVSEAENAVSVLRGGLSAESAEERPSKDAAPPALGEADPWARLTKRQQDIARLSAQGQTSRQVAESLEISVRTVDYHMGHVLSKLKLRSRRELRHIDVQASQSVD